jgi:inhibitor of KinA
VSAGSRIAEELPSLAWTSERTLRIQVGSVISEGTSARVRSLLAALRSASLDSVVDITPAYTTILLTFDPLTLDRTMAVKQVAPVLGNAADAAPPPARHIETPVCYAPEFAPDLADVAAHHAITPEEVVRRHSTQAYRVEFLGFSPGFAYLAGLPDSLVTPRLDRPRPRVPAGSVAIGGGQTGIYPHATPGGWRIIGRTPLAVFDAAREAPAMLAIGDEVRFVPVDRPTFDRMAQEHSP